MTVFTTRPDTLFGATFMVVAPDSDLAAELAAGSTPEVQTAFAAYLEQVQKSTEIERQDAGREKTGIPLDRWAINPVNGERIPIWTADYVLADYGHGAVMGVPAHDQRDLDFALQVRARRARRRRHERAGDGRAAGHHPRDAANPARLRRSTRSRPARRSTATAG